MGTGLGHENHQTIDLTHSAPALPSLSSLSCLPPPRVVTVHTLSANLRSKCLSFTNKVMNNKRKGFLGTISLYLWHLKTVNGPCNSYWDQFNALAASQRRRFENTCSTCLANIYAWSGQSWESKVIKPCHYHYHQTHQSWSINPNNNKVSASISRSQRICSQSLQYFHTVGYNVQVRCEDLSSPWTITLTQAESQPMAAWDKDPWTLGKLFKYC